MKKTVAVLVGIIVLILGVSVALAGSTWRITTPYFDYFPNDASGWLETSENRASVAAGFYMYTPQEFQDAVGTPDKVLIAKTVKDDNETEYLRMDFYSSSGAVYWAAFYPDNYDDLCYGICSNEARSHSFVLDMGKTYYTISSGDFKTAYDDHIANNIMRYEGNIKQEEVEDSELTGEEDSTQTVLTVKVTSLESYGYDASTWISTGDNRAYAAAALYGEAPEKFRTVVGMPAKVLIAKSTMNDNETEFLYIDFYSSAGKCYWSTLYPLGTPKDQYAHGFCYTEPAILSMVTNLGKKYYTITASEFEAAYEKWLEEDHGRETDKPSSGNFKTTMTFSSSGTKEYSFTMPSAGKMDITLNRTCSSSDYTYYLQIYNGSTLCLDTHNTYAVDTTSDTYGVGLEEGSYKLKIRYSGGFFPHSATFNITGTFTAGDTYEKEPNNVISSAEIMKLNTLYTGYFGEEYSGEDYYSFQAKEGLTYKIRINNYKRLSDTTTLIALYDSNGKKIKGLSSASAATNDYLFEFTPDISDTYYIRFYNYSSYKGEQGIIEYQTGVYLNIDPSSLKNLDLPEKISTIEEEAFKGAAFEAVIIPYGCTMIGSKAFADNWSLIYVSIPSSVTKLSEDAFKDCTNLMYVKLPASLTDITEEDFSNDEIILERVK